MSVITNITGVIKVNSFKFNRSEFKSILDYIASEEDPLYDYALNSDILRNANINADNCSRVDNLFYRINDIEDDDCFILNDNIVIDIDINHFDMELVAWLLLLQDSIETLSIYIDHEYMEENIGYINEKTYTKYIEYEFLEFKERYKLEYEISVKIDEIKGMK